VLSCPVRHGPGDDVGHKFLLEREREASFIFFSRDVRRCGVHVGWFFLWGWGDDVGIALGDALCGYELESKRAINRPSGLHD
jgi:hypothetical protein